MVDLLTLAAFIPAAFALNLTPGPDMLFCFGQGVRSGPYAAAAAGAGVSLGSMVHVTLAGLGLGAMIVAAPWAFDIIRWVGVGYLLFLAIRVLRDTPQTTEKGPALSVRRAFWSGLMVNLTNPKVILFVLAFIPQFVRPEAGSVLGQFLVLGVVISAGGFVINAGVGILAGGIGHRLARGSRVLNWLTAGLFVGLAGRLAVLERA